MSLAWQAVPAPPAPPGIPDPVVVMHNGGPDAWQAVMLAVMTVAGCLFLYRMFGPLVTALARRLEGRGGSAALEQRVEELEARLAELETSSHRVAELEERLDFAERLLAQGRAGERLPAREEEQ